MIVEGFVEKDKFGLFKLVSGHKKIPMTTGNMVMWLSLRIEHIKK